jgi:hypothetical protein
MSYNNGPRIVTNGLVLCLDAANRKSYPASGTVWNDLSSNNNNGTLTNGPTYNSSNGGSIVFDGLDDGIDCGTVSVFDINSNFTICAMIRPIGFGGGGLGRVVDKGTINTGGYVLYVTSPNSFVFQIGRSTGGSTITATNAVILNEWQYFAATLTNTTLTIYKNGLVINTTPTSPATSTVKNFFIGNRATTFDRGFAGNIGIISFYDRVLSSAEILQNYNAIKGRFNL